MDSKTKELHKNIEQFLLQVQIVGYPIKIHPATRISEIELNQDQKEIRIELSKYFSFVPFRETNVGQIYSEIRKSIDGDYEDYKLQVLTLGQPIENLIPNYYRSNKADWDIARLANVMEKRPKPIVRRVDQTENFTLGLYGSNIALWHSHGWYYNQDLDRWLWQRADKCPRLIFCQR